VSLFCKQQIASSPEIFTCAVRIYCNSPASVAESSEGLGETCATAVNSLLPGELAGRRWSSSDRRKGLACLTVCRPTDDGRECIRGSGSASRGKSWSITYVQGMYGPWLYIAAAYRVSRVCSASYMLQGTRPRTEALARCAGSAVEQSWEACASMLDGRIKEQKKKTTIAMLRMPLLSQPNVRGSG
jgi:hypothetical protein